MIVNNTIVICLHMHMFTKSLMKDSFSFTNIAEHQGKQTHKKYWIDIVVGFYFGVTEKLHLYDIIHQPENICPIF